MGNYMDDVHFAKHIFSKKRSLINFKLPFGNFGQQYICKISYSNSISSMHCVLWSFWMR